MAMHFDSARMQIVGLPEKRLRSALNWLHAPNQSILSCAARLK